MRLDSILNPFPVWKARCCQKGQNVCTLLSILSILGRKRSRSKDPDFLPVSILDSKQVSYTYGPYREQPYGVAIYYQRLEWLRANLMGLCAGWADKNHGKTIPCDGSVLCYTRHAFTQYTHFFVT
jgi:hypothetical protein